MSGYIHAAREGAAYDWHGARIIVKASGEDTLGQLGVMEATYPQGLHVPTHVFVPRDRPHGFVVTSTRPARALVITGPSQLDRQVAATGTPVPRPR